MQSNSVGIQCANEENQMQRFDKIVSMSTFKLKTMNNNFIMSHHKLHSLHAWLRMYYSGYDENEYDSIECVICRLLNDFAMQNIILIIFLNKLIHLICIHSFRAMIHLLDPSKRSTQCSKLITEFIHIEIAVNIIVVEEKEKRR